MKPHQTLFFWCCKQLGLCCLDYLLTYVADHEIPISCVGVCISEDDNIHPIISKLAMKYHIPVFAQTPENVFADVGIVIGYPHKISPEVIQHFKHGIVNLHFAPLPYYRGSKTLPQAIIHGEKNYGVTLHYIDEHLDTGPIIDVRWKKLDETKTGLELIHEYEDLAFSLFQEYCPKLLVSPLLAIDQQEYIYNHHITPKFYTRQDFEKLYQLSLEWSFDKLYTHVRALTLGNNKHPFIQNGQRRIYLTLDAGDDL